MERIDQKQDASDIAITRKIQPIKFIIARDWDRIQDKYVEKREIIDLASEIKELKNLNCLKQEGEDIRSDLRSQNDSFSLFTNQIKDKISDIEKELGSFVKTSKGI